MPEFRLKAIALQEVPLVYFLGVKCIEAIVRLDEAVNQESLLFDPSFFVNLEVFNARERRPQSLKTEIANGVDPDTVLNPTG